MASILREFFKHSYQNPDHQCKEGIVEQLAFREKGRGHLPGGELEPRAHEIEGDDKEVEHADHAQELGRVLEVELPSCVLLR